MVTSVSNSHANQALYVRPHPAAEEASRTNAAAHGTQQTVANDTGAGNATPAPTVNTSGQTLGQVINVTA